MEGRKEGRNERTKERRKKEIKKARHAERKGTGRQRKKG